MIEVSPLAWFLTAVWFFGLLIGDLLLNRNKQSEISTHEAIIRSIVWISLGVGFGFVVWLMYGAHASAEYFSGFLIEKSLSVDNIFVWSVLLAYLKIPRKLQYTVLFWGILGAIIFRTAFMFAGVVIIENFNFMLLILGGLLLYTAYGIYANKSDEEFNPENSKVLKYVEKFLPFTTKVYDKKLFVKVNGKHIATYLMFAICVVELTDILFAIDSVPTVLAVVREPYIAITSNVAAILGLRALYFVFDNLKESFWLLNKGLGVVLAGVGLTLLFEPETIFGIEWFGLELPVWVTLSFILFVLGVSIAGSLLIKQDSSNKT